MHTSTAARRPRRITKSGPESRSGTVPGTFRFLVQYPAPSVVARCVTFPSPRCHMAACVSTTKARLSTAVMNCALSCTLRCEQSKSLPHARQRIGKQAARRTPQCRDRSPGGQIRSTPTAQKPLPLPPTGRPIRLCRPPRRRFVPDRNGSVPILPKERDPRLITVRRGGTLTDGHRRPLADWALLCAEHVLHLFADQQPGDG